MRAWPILVVVGWAPGCRDAHESQPTNPSLPEVATHVAADAFATDSPSASNDDDMGRRIADEVVKLRDNWLVYLHDLGWIQLHDKYARVQARWTSSPKLLAEVNHQPPPKPPAAWRDERGRYMAAIHDGDQNPPGEDPNLDVVSLYWSMDFIDRVHRELVDKQAVTIPHVGRLSLERDAAGVRVVFEASPELVQRLTPR
jgi:hypothetical protein